MIFNLRDELLLQILFLYFENEDREAQFIYELYL